jgi:hypothetical protein
MAEEGSNTSRGRKSNVFDIADLNYALLISIDKYDHYEGPNGEKLANLPSTKKDLEVTEELLRNYNFEITKFVNNEANFKVLDDYLDKLYKKVETQIRKTPTDKRIVFYAFFSGHGYFTDNE